MMSNARASVHLSHQRCSRWMVQAAVIALGLVLGLSGPLRAGLQQVVERVVNGSNLGEARIGVMIRDANSGLPLATFHAERPMIPASNMKLITTAAALKILGPDYVFKTKLLLDGRTLIIRGDGDPGFGDPKLLEALGMDVEDLLAMWVHAVKRTGIEKIERILVDDRVFDQQFVHPHWPEDQLLEWYCAQVAGINFHDNCLAVYAYTTKPGQPPRIRTMPMDPPIPMINEAVTGDDNAFWADREMGTNHIVFRGEVTHDLIAPIQVTIHDPPIFFANVLRDRLIKAGLEVGKVKRIPEDWGTKASQASPPGDPVLLAVVQTPMPTLLKRCNRDSQNLFAEALFKRIGHEVSGQPGSWQNGAAAVRMFLSNFIGSDAAEVVVDDGSGLSRYNRVSPAVLTELLWRMHQSERLGAVYLHSLAVPGEEGTLDDRFAGYDLEGEMHAKSGYIRWVITLSGYLLYDQRDIVFSVMINNFRRGPWYAKQIIDRLVAKVDAYMADHLEAQGVRLGG